MGDEDEGEPIEGVLYVRGDTTAIVRYNVRITRCDAVDPDAPTDEMQWKFRAETTSWPKWIRTAQQDTAGD